MNNSRKIKTEVPDLAHAQWKRSSFCDGGLCVEIARIKEGFAVRDAKQSNGPVLTFTKSEWHAFVAGVKNGEFE